MRVPRNVSYEQRNKVYSSLQYGITEWLVDIQNMGTFTGEKLKKKFCSLKFTRPLDEFVIFDTRPQDFIVVSREFCKIWCYFDKVLPPLRKKKKSESSEQSSKYEKEQQKCAFLPTWLGLSTWMKVSSKLKV